MSSARAAAALLWCIDRVQGPGVGHSCIGTQTPITFKNLPRKSESLTTLKTYTTHRDMRVPGKTSATTLF